MGRVGAGAVREVGVPRERRGGRGLPPGGCGAERPLGGHAGRGVPLEPSLRRRGQRCTRRHRRRRGPRRPVRALGAGRPRRRRARGAGHPTRPRRGVRQRRRAARRRRAGGPRPLLRRACPDAARCGDRAWARVASTYGAEMRRTEHPGRGAAPRSGGTRVA
nr:hypothetical protein [Angustibacter aerolatus]